MPRATRASTKPTTTNDGTKPYPSTRPTDSFRSRTTNSTPETAVKPRRKVKDGKASHLYTDDNPSTTLHGTGFKDEATARQTLELVSKRSLVYQFQTINTMYHRAAHHKSSTTNLNIQAAMKVFRSWLDNDYHEAKAAQRNYPLLKKEVVELYLPQIRAQAVELGIESEWAEQYIVARKKLANILMDDSKPEERDLAVVRQNFLDSVVNNDFNGEVPPKDNESLWDGQCNVISSVHMKLIAYGFSPVRHQILEKTLENNDTQRTNAV